MRKIIGLILFVALSTVFYQCAKDPVDLTGSISGTITDSETKEPIKGAVVVISTGGDTKTTGSDGKFEYKDLDATTYSIDVSCSDYESDTKETSVVAGKAAQLDFALVAIKPELTVNLSALSFDEDTSQLSFEIKNTGKGELTWELSKTADWLTLSTVSGTTTTTTTIIATINRDGLTAQTYNDVIVVASNAGSHEIKVTISVPQPTIGVSVESVNFGTDDSMCSIEISNTGKGTLTWEITKTSDWLSINPTSGSTESTVSIVLASASRDGLSTGDYTDKIIITSNAGTKEIPVTMSVAGASMSISVESLDFGTAETLYPIEISNTDKGTLEWEITKTSSWLSLSPTSGSTGSDVSIVMVSADRTGLSAGDYNDKLVITSNAGSKEIPVTMSVSGAVLDVSPLGLDYGEVTATKQLTLTNTSGIGSIQYTIEKSHDWISLDKTSGTLSSSSQTTMMNVVVDRTGLSAGNYSGKLTIKSDVTSDIEVTITMQIKLDEAPTVSIGVVSDLSYNSTKMEGSVVSIGSHAITSHGFCWATTSEPTISNTTSNYGSRSEIGSFSGTIGNLSADTKYYIRAYATNQIGTSYSSEYSFTTSSMPVVATIQTTDATSVTSNSATLNGNIESVGNSTISEHGFIYNTNSSLNLTSGTKIDLGSKGTSLGTFYGKVLDLTYATKYYFRSYAVNEVGTSYGDILTFTTLTETPTLTTKEATGLTHNRAMSGGDITFTGGNIITERGVCWSATNQTPTISNSYVVSDDDTDSFEAEITGLETTTAYYSRAYIRVSEDVYYGDVRSFVTTTYKEIPTVETNEVLDISIDCATVYCYIPSDGGSTVTARGVCWSTTPGATTSNNIVSCSSGSGNYTANITGLSMGQTVYVKAYATNEVGTAYGEELSFTTRSSNVIYVSKTNGSDTNNGDSWSTAYATITKAIENAPSGFQVWVDNATYSNEGITMKEGVDVYGGFEGNETELTQRPSESYTPLLRQVILQETNFSTKTIVDGFKVLNCSSATAVTLLNNGVGSNLWVDNCTSSTVYVYGGMMTNCYIKNNTAPYMIEAINSEITNCEISDNSCSTSCLAATNSTIESCIIHDNIITGGNGNVISSTGSTVINNLNFG